MTFVVPCRRPENTSDDWFIDQRGKQYGDDVLVDVKAIEAEMGYDHLNGFAELGDDDLALLEADVIADNLKRRRRARQACHTDCILRTQCLEAGLEEPFGTWGGYYEEERRQIVKLRDEKARERAERGGGGA